MHSADTAASPPASAMTENGILRHLAFRSVFYIDICRFRKDM